MQNKKYIFILVGFLIALGVVTLVVRYFQGDRGVEDGRIRLNYEERMAKEKALQTLTNDSSRVVLTAQQKSLKAKLLAQ